MRTRREILGLTWGVAGFLGLSRHAFAAERSEANLGAMKRGTSWLLAQQAQDGGWHSSSYGALQGGAAITALVLYTLARLPAALLKKEADRWRRAISFFEPGIKKRKTLANADGSLDYPTYAVPMWLVASEQLGLALPADQKKELTEYLISAQLRNLRGFERSHAAYGGWDFLGAADAQGITTGSTVSVVCYAVQALSKSEHGEAKTALSDAKGWLFRNQDATGDGGFTFTPEPMSLNNKAEFRDAKQSRPRSYGSATADGLRALVYCGVPRNDRRVLQAAEWILKRPGIQLVPGFDDLPLELGWQRGLRYYYLASLSGCLTFFPAAEAAEFKSKIGKALVEEQKSDGSWQSDAPRMREDDPMIATCFALSALANC